MLCSNRSRCSKTCWFPLDQPDLREKKIPSQPFEGKLDICSSDHMTSPLTNLDDPLPLHAKPQADLQHPGQLQYSLP